MVMDVFSPFWDVETGFDPSPFSEIIDMGDVPASRGQKKTEDTSEHVRTVHRKGIRSTPSLAVVEANLGQCIPATTEQSQHFRAALIVLHRLKKNYLGIPDEPPDPPARWTED